MLMAKKKISRPSKNDFAPVEDLEIYSFTSEPVLNECCTIHFLNSTTFHWFFSLFHIEPLAAHFQMFSTYYGPCGYKYIYDF
jgi:hypothetical protein